MKWKLFCKVQKKKKLLQSVHRVKGGQIWGGKKWIFFMVYYATSDHTIL